MKYERTDGGSVAMSAVDFDDLPKGKAPGKPVTVTDGNFETFIKHYDKVVVDCWAPWCGPCKILAPTIDELAGEVDGNVAFGKLNTDENNNTAQRFKIMGIPTLMFFKNGEKVDQIVGVVPKSQIETKLTGL